MKKIMIVDDDPDIIFTIKEGLELEENKYKIFSFKDGRECLKFLKNNETPDLILLDIMMPGMSGWDVYDCVINNSNWKDIPIIFISARTDEIAKKTGGFLGDDYIEKPFEIEDLIKRIDKIFEKKKEI